MKLMSGRCGCTQGVEPVAGNHLGKADHLEQSGCRFEWCQQVQVLSNDFLGSRLPLAKSAGPIAWDAQV